MSWLCENPERLEKFRQGDEQTLTEVYYQYVREVAGFLRAGFTFNCNGRSFRFCGCHTPFELDDFLQETFLRAFTQRTRETYDGVRPYRAYLLTIARNVAIDRLRHSQRWSRLFVPMSTQTANKPQPAEAPITTSPEKILVSKQLSKIYHNFKASLIELDRSVCELRFEQSLTRKQTTQRLGLSAMQLRVREHRLRTKLLKQLGNSGYEPKRELASLCI
ncbi:MAG: sigma-70 family RNA polymerase sigma factor [Deltaproteobacteria bacterium]|nr:sigma-70 family RNA polymerase sigma factor [Deltaproteobacteria bacterium]